MKWLSLVEWWYNTNHHSAINSTPYEVVYGQPSPVHIPYIGGESRVESVDRTLTTREQAIATCKFHGQDRMKSQADKHRTDREFVVGDWVYLKLQPHRQVTIRKGKQNKLSPKYYGPFQILDKVGQVAYRLQLPSSAQIHNVFHISQLEKCKGAVNQSGELPACDDNGVLLVEPKAILERRLAKKGNAATVFGLVQWSNGSKEDASWEPLEEIQKKFPNFIV